MKQPIAERAELMQKAQRTGIVRVLVDGDEARPQNGSFK